MRILVADDHPLLRKGLIDILKEGFGPIEAGEAGSAPEVLQQVHRQNWDVVVLDISMPGGGGFSVLNDIKSSSPETPVLVFSMHPEEQYALRALRAGAVGYVTKDSPPKTLRDAVRKAVQGGKYISESLAERLADSLRSKSTMDAPPHDALSDREYQVMLMLAEGKTATQISEDLSLSIKTISTYRTRIMRKLRLETNAQLARYAMTNKLLN